MHTKNLYKNPLISYLLKLKKFHCDSVKNESAWAKTLKVGGKRRPPPSLFRVNCGGGGRRGLKLTPPLFFLKQFFSTCRDNGLGDFNGLVHGRGLIYPPPLLHAGTRVVISLLPPSLFRFRAKKTLTQNVCNFFQ